MLRHLSVWFGLYLLVLIITFSFFQESFPSAANAVFSLTATGGEVILIFYIHFIICELFWSKKLKFIFAVFVVYSLFLGLQYLIESQRTDTPRPDIFFILFLVSLYYFLIISIATISWSVKTSKTNKEKLLKDQLRLELSNNELHQKNLLLQNQLLSTEIKFLRAQINPHFLFNSLNFLYAEILESQPATADGIMTLSQIMRYSLRDFSKNKGMADLEEELEHIQNVIKIHQMRFNHSLNIAVDLNCNEKNIGIIPMALITLVENVFKHGNLHNQSNPAIIICKTNEDEQKIYFSTFNIKRNKTAGDNVSGIGITNIRQRMEKVYGNRFILEVEDKMDSFKVKLKVPYYTEIPEPLLKQNNIN